MLKIIYIFGGFEKFKLNKLIIIENHFASKNKWN